MPRFQLLTFCLSDPTSIKNLCVDEVEILCADVGTLPKKIHINSCLFTDNKGKGTVIDS